MYQISLVTYEPGKLEFKIKRSFTANSAESVDIALRVVAALHYHQLTEEAIQECREVFNLPNRERTLEVGPPEGRRCMITVTWVQGSES